MPKYATELTQGQTFSRTSEENGINDTAQRVYKILLLHPGEVFNPQAYTGTYIGSRHPFNLNLVCFSYDAKFDGESRMVSIVTFNYRNYATVAASAGQQDPKTVTPYARPANYSTDTSLMEIPCSTWKRWENDGQLKGKPVYPANPNGDRYDGVSKMVPMTTIRVDQYEPRDPMINTEWVGCINSEDIWMGGRKFPKHTIMLRGVSSKAHVETFRDQQFRGWIATYDLAHRMNMVTIPPSTTPFALGWDRLQPLEGFYVKNNRKNDPDVDVNALSLEHLDYKVKVNAPLAPPAAYEYAAGTQGEKVRAQVAFPCPTGGWAQRPSASPVALNADGTPRNVQKVDNNGDPVYYPLVYRYQVQDDADLVTVMNLRLF